MIEIIGWILLGFAPGMIIGMAIGQHWDRWDQKSMTRYEPDEHEDLGDMSDIYHMIDQHRQQDWNRKQAD